MATAVAHPNIALVKYWGKQPGSANVPATPSLSITLDALATRTRVEAREAGADDAILLNGQPVADARISRFIGSLRVAYDLPPLAVATGNDFPTGAGLASSASGFAALVTAVDDAFDLGLAPGARSTWARRGSASAARSIFGGFVVLAGDARQDADWVAAPLLDKEAWPLEVVVAVTSEDVKEVSSTQGMERSRTTSPFYPAWIRGARDDFRHACEAVLERNFDALADLAEHSCLKLHAVMLASRPALLYWNSATVAAIRAVRTLRADGVPTFFTVDAGPQVKAVCAPGRAAEVAAALANVPGVARVVASGLGDGARPVNAANG